MAAVRQPAGAGRRAVGVADRPALRDGDGQPARGHRPPARHLRGVRPRGLGLRQEPRALAHGPGPAPCRDDRQAGQARLDQDVHGPLDAERRAPPAVLRPRRARPMARRTRPDPVLRAAVVRRRCAGGRPRAWSRPASCPCAAATTVRGLRVERHGAPHRRHRRAQPATSVRRSAEPEKYERLAFTFCRMGTIGLIAWVVGAGGLRARRRDRRGRAVRAARSRSASGWTQVLPAPAHATSSGSGPSSPRSTRTGSSCSDSSFRPFDRSGTLGYTPPASDGIAVRGRVRAGWPRARRERHETPGLGR